MLDLGVQQSTQLTKFSQEPIKVDAVFFRLLLWAPGSHLS